MPQYISVEFPGQELGNTLDKIQTLLDAAKAFAKQLVLEQNIKEAIVKCIEAVQALLCEDQNQTENLQQGIEDDYMVRLSKEQRRQYLQQQENGTLTPEEQEEMDKEQE